MTQSRRRYPGVSPFETNQADQYFGRTRDVQDLYDLILLEKMVVLFGKSGYGKSSLLNAGIIPKLSATKSKGEQLFHPIVVRFAAYTKGSTDSPLERVSERLKQVLGPVPDVPLLSGFTELRHTLWFQVKARQNALKTRYVLIFDQFEEFFTYPKEQQLLLREQLAELLFTEIPQELRMAWDDLSDAEQEFLSTELNLRVVFAVREDRLSWLNSLKEELPGILDKRYELKGLSDEQAREAILQPAALPQDLGFQCHPFSYRPEALNILLKELKKSNAGENYTQQGRIEAFLLQICCENIESRLLERAKTGDVDTVVDPEDLPSFDQIYEEYYNNKINELPTEERENAKRLIEDELIGFNESTGLVFRLNADGRRLLDKPGISEALLKRLTNAFLLRSEPNTTGGYNYEISHDTLIAPIEKAKKMRLEAEAARKQRRQLQRGILIVVLAVGLAVGAFVVTAWALDQRNKANEALAKADALSLNLLEEKIQRQRRDIQEWERKQQVYRDGDLPDQAKEAQDSINVLEDLLQKNDSTLSVLKKNKPK